MERGALSLSVGDGVVERLIADHLKNELTSVYYTCRDLGSDVFAVGKAAATRFFDAEAFERFDWKGMFLKTDAEFDVAVRLEYDPARAKGE